MYFTVSNFAVPLYIVQISKQVPFVDRFLINGKSYCLANGICELKTPGKIQGSPRAPPLYVSAHWVSCWWTSWRQPSPSPSACSLARRYNPVPCFSNTAGVLLGSKRSSNFKIQIKGNFMVGMELSLMRAEYLRRIKGTSWLALHQTRQKFTETTDALGQN